MEQVEATAATRRYWKEIAERAAPDGVVGIDLPEGFDPELVKEMTGYFMDRGLSVSINNPPGKRAQSGITPPVGTDRD